ncbi:MAG TPA: protein arginine kinase [Phycisphaerae bacterium]|nr:protein arginine kinase [Phycisphaerales bacterium]HRX83668.1 protein arginine kinase [Phycisphaerae bacterium]
MSVNDLTGKVGEWLRGIGPMADIVISSRIRLARNLANFPFLCRASEDERREIFRTLTEAFSSAKLDHNTYLLDMEELDEIDRQVLVERHLISKQHADGEGCRGVAVSASETRALMINEEDHLRMQVLRSGLQLEPLWEEISDIDNQIEAQTSFAFDEKLGYLTACPTNVGTGLRVSVMLHLPALKMTGEIEKVLRAAKDLRLAVRGLYGEGTDAIGDFYQISNQITLGHSEEEIIEKFSENIIPRIVEYERAARNALADERSMQLDDKVWRAYGILENARTMASDETLFFLSHVRMGVSMGRLQGIDVGTINELFLRIQPAHLQKMHGHALNGEERSVARAKYLRSRLGHQN